MSSKIRAMRYFMRARLSRRIVLWVFASILLIEAVILLPSIYRRQQELLTHLKELSAAQVKGALGATSPTNTPTKLLSQLEKSAPDAVVRGGALYRLSGELVDHFGELPELTIAKVKANPNATFYNRAAARYDAAWEMKPLAGYVLIVRHDATAVQQEMIAFIGRIAILVTIISIFVTIVTLIGLERILVTPILSLRNDLLKVGNAIRQDKPSLEFDSLRLRRNDELGEVIAAFDQMYQQVTAAITERSQVEIALRQSEEKFSKAFRASPSAILISALADGRIIEVNDSFLQLYGSSLAEVIGKKAADLKLWAEPADRVKMLQQLKQIGSVRNLEYMFCNKRGEPRAILFSAELINLDGEECLVSVANDITERKQAEKALERLAEIGELAAMIVHEVRNPLTTVMMGLKSFESLDLPESAHQRLELAVEEANRLQRLLNEILQYARCQTLQAEELEVNTLIQEILATSRETLTDGRQLEFIPTDPLHILGDRDKLKQVFINLISNACEAILEGEKITWSVDLCQNQQAVCIDIHNSGTPISSEVLTNLGKPFFTTKSTGNGLGLAIVKRIVEAHKGELEIESSDAIGGTRVRVVMPLVSKMSL